MGAGLGKAQMVAQFGCEYLPSALMSSTDFDAHSFTHISLDLNSFANSTARLVCYLRYLRNDLVPN